MTANMLSGTGLGAGGQMKDKMCFRWLMFYVGVLALAQISCLAYFLTPGTPHRQTSVRRLAFRPLSSPTFKFSYPVQGEHASDTVWRDVEISEDDGRRLMTLLRGSPSWSAVVQEFLREHPGSMVPSQRFPDSVGRLSAYEDHSDKPSLSIEFLGYDQVLVWRPDSKENTFFPSPEQTRRIKDAIDDIQWGPVPKD
jgi:hypothetical protein